MLPFVSSHWFNHFPPANALKNYGNIYVFESRHNLPELKDQQMLGYKIFEKNHQMVERKTSNCWDLAYLKKQQMLQFNIFENTSKC